MTPDPHIPAGNSAFDKLEQDARTEDNRMKRTEAPYTADELKRLATHLLDFKTNCLDRAGKQISWESLAKKIGTTAGVLNAWVHQKYDGDVERIARLVDQFLSDEAGRRKRPNCSSYQTIGNAKLAFAVCGVAARDNVMVGIIGPSGCGKTSVLRAYHSSRRASVFVTVGEMDGSKAGITRLLLNGIFATTGSSEAMPATSYERWAMILEYFSGNHNAVLIVDECQKLRRDGLEVLRDLHDKSDLGGQRNLPIILGGDRSFYRHMLNTRAGRTSPVGPQFLRRISPVFDYEQDGRAGDGSSGEMYSESDLAAICQNDRLRLVTPEGVRWLKSLANLPGYGHLGTVNRVLRNTLKIEKNPPFTVEHLEEGLGMTVNKKSKAAILAMLRGEPELEERAAKVG